MDSPSTGNDFFMWQMTFSFHHCLGYLNSGEMQAVRMTDAFFPQKY